MSIRNIITICCFFALITACSNEPSIKSATPEKVIIGGPPDKFTSAYELAKIECQKNTKTAQYIQDHSANLKEVAFNCVGSEAETEQATVEETATEDKAETEQAPVEDAEATVETEK